MLCERIAFFHGGRKWSGEAPPSEVHLTRKGSFLQLQRRSGGQTDRDKGEEVFGKVMKLPRKLTACFGCTPACNNAITA